MLLKIQFEFKAISTKDHVNVSLYGVLSVLRAFPFHAQLKTMEILHDIDREVENNWIQNSGSDPVPTIAFKMVFCIFILELLFM